MRRRTLLASCLLLLTAHAALDAQTRPAARTVVIKNMAYAPAALTVKVGETVTWSNQDDRDHTVTGEKNAFKSGNLSSGRSFSHRFTRPGTYPYGCAYHPRMKGTVTVRE